MDRSDLVVPRPRERLHGNAKRRIWVWRRCVKCRCKFEIIAYSPADKDKTCLWCFFGL